MAVRYTDTEIVGFIRERKLLPENYRSLIKLRPKRGHNERELVVLGEEGNQFRLILRENRLNPLDFSVILGLRPKESTELFRLRRYNGKSHEHTNHLERETIWDFHIHTATERYQDLGAREDSYAERTDRYGTLQEALQCLWEDCAFEIPQEFDPQQKLF